MWQKVFKNDAFCGIMHETAAEQKESRSPETPADIVILFILMYDDLVNSKLDMIEGFVPISAIRYDAKMQEAERL